jgi:hypothetical protein
MSDTKSTSSTTHDKETGRPLKRLRHDKDREQDEAEALALALDETAEPFFVLEIRRDVEDSFFCRVPRSNKSVNALKKVMRLCKEVDECFNDFYDYNGDKNCAQSGFATTLMEYFLWVQKTENERKIEKKKNPRIGLYDSSIEGCLKPEDVRHVCPVTMPDNFKFDLDEVIGFENALKWEQLYRPPGSSIADDESLIEPCFMNAIWDQ